MKTTEKKKITRFELALILVNVAVYIVWIIFNHDLLSWISWASYMLYIFSLYLSSVGKWQTHVYNILSYLFYLYICIYFFYLGELASTIINIIISTILIFVWKKNEIKTEDGQKKVQIKKVRRNEIILVNTAGVIAFGIFYVIFMVSNSEHVLLNALLLALTALSYYFYYRISKISFIYAFLCEIVYIILWALTLSVGENVASIYIIGTVFSVFWTVYSLYNWNKMEKEQATDKNIKDINPTA